MGREMGILGKEKGQTSVEYILMLAVVALMATKVFGWVREGLLEDAGNCTRASTSLICQLEGIWTGHIRGGGASVCGLPYRCFSIK